MLQKTHYTAPIGSLVDQAIEWFTANPDEELTIPDVAQKFDVTRSIVRACLRPAVKAGVLLYTRADDQEYVYRLGAAPYSIAPAAKTHSEMRALQWQALLSKPTPATLNARAADTPAITPKPKPKRKPSKPSEMVTPCPFDLAALQVETGVPIPPRAHLGPCESKWALVFDPLTQKGMSLEFPAAWKVGVTAFSVKLNRKLGVRRYHVRLVTTGKARIWRIA